MISRFYNEANKVIGQFEKSDTRKEQVSLKRSGIKRQSYFKQISRERSEGVDVVEVESNKGV